MNRTSIPTTVRTGLTGFRSTGVAGPNSAAVSRSIPGMLSRSVIVLCAMVFSACLHAAPADWWVDVTNDRVENVRTLLAQGADPNELSPNGQPAIMQAIRDGAWKVYDVLLANPKTVLNAININRETPLMYLAVLGETKRAQDLIRRGALVNRLGWTPLQYAASKGQVDTVKMLLANKALVNAPAPDGTTALMMAAYAGSEPVVQVLLAAGADVTTQNLEKQDAADWARIKKYDALAARLDALTDKTLKKRSALHAKNRAANIESTSNEAAQESGVQASPRDDAHAGSKAVAQPDEDTRPQTQKQDDAETSSSSRYFDLKRFDEKPNP